MAQTSTKDISTLLARSLTAVQSTLARQLMGGALSAQDRDQALAAIRAVLPSAEQADFALEEQKIAHALAAGISPSPPRLHTVSLQLLWAAHLTYLCCNGHALVGTSLWKQLTECSDAKHELMRHALYIARDQFNKDTLLKWGVPGSMFYFQRKANTINIDFVMSLIGGFEDTRSIIFHEIGHSKLTRHFSPLLQKTQREMEHLYDKGKKDKLSADEYKRLFRLYTVQDYLFRLFDEAENNPVNRYSINAGDRVKQDMGLSLNTVEITIAQAATHKLPQEKNPETEFANFKRAVRMSLYKNNDLFKDTPDGWRQVGVRPEWIAALPVMQDGAALTPAQAFAELMDLCGGVQGLEQLQPRTVDRMKGPAWLEKATEDYADRRNQIIDDLWKRYAEPILVPLLDAAEQKAEEKYQQAAQQQAQNQKSQKQGQGDAQSQGSGQKGQSGGQQGSPTSSSDDQGGSTGNSGASGEQSGSMQPSSDQASSGKESSTQDGSDASKTPTNPDSSQGQKASTDNDKQDNAEHSGDAGEKENAADPSDTDSVWNTVDVVGAGKLPIPKLPPKTPQEAAAQQAGQGGDSEDGQEGQSLGELLKQMEQAEKQQKNQDGKGEPTAGEMKPQPNSSGAKGPGGKSSGSSRPVMGDWGNYQENTKLFSPEINQARKLLVQIQEKQSTRSLYVSHERDLLPEDGDMSLFDEVAHEALVKKILMGDPIAEQDAQRFQVIQESKTPASIDIVVEIDGSSSMYWTVGGPYSPAQAGMQMGCILYEASKKPRNHKRPHGKEGDINVWVFVWGNNPPECVARPGDRPQKIGESIASVQTSRGWGTSLAPCVFHTTSGLAAEKRSSEQPVGYTHRFVFSDGDIGDPSDAYTAIDVLLTNCQKTTYDVLVVNDSSGKTGMERIIDALQEKHGNARIKATRCSRPEDVHATVLCLLRDRMLATTNSEAEPFRNRRKSLIKAKTAMLNIS